MLDTLEEILSTDVSSYAIISATIVLLLAVALSLSQRKLARHVRSAVFSDSVEADGEDEYLVKNEPHLLAESGSVKAENFDSLIRG